MAPLPFRLSRATNSGLGLPPPVWEFPEPWFNSAHARIGCQPGVPPESPGASGTPVTRTLPSESAIATVAASTAVRARMADGVEREPATAEKALAGTSTTAPLDPT